MIAYVALGRGVGLSLINLIYDSECNHSLICLRVRDACQASHRNDCTAAMRRLRAKFRRTLVTGHYGTFGWNESGHETNLRISLVLREFHLLVRFSCTLVAYGIFVKSSVSECVAFSLLPMKTCSIHHPLTSKTLGGNS